jgi:hypothetical protein
LTLLGRFTERRVERRQDPRGQMRGTSAVDEHEQFVHVDLPLVGERVSEVGSESGTQEATLPPPDPALAIARGVLRGILRGVPGGARR